MSVYGKITENVILIFLFCVFQVKRMSNIKYNETADGIRLLCVNTDKFKTNFINIDLYVPLGEDLPAQYVLSSLLAHASRDYPTFKSFNSKVESLYGASFSSAINNYGDNVRLSFALELPDDRFALYGETFSAEAVDFLTNILLYPLCSDGKFDETAATREIRFTLEELEAKKNDKRSYALSRLKQLMCGNEKYGVDSEWLENEVRALTPERLFTAYKNLMSTAQIVVTACGTLSEEMLSEKISCFAKEIENRNVKELTFEFVTEANEIRYFNESMKMMNQSKLVIGLRSGMENNTDNYYAYRIMTDVFGGGPYSRLFSNVREKLSLCYYCSARLIRQKGIIFVQSGIENENYGKALDEIFNQLQVMKNGEFTDEELESSKRALADAYCGVEDSPSGVCTYFASQCFADEIISGKEEAKALLSVTREDVIKCAQKTVIDSVYLLSGEGNGEDE